jgi:hypothetical protein
MSENIENMPKPNYFKVIDEMAKVVIDLMKEDYSRWKQVGNRKRRAVASGTLRNSLAYRLKIKGAAVDITVYAKGDAQNYYEAVEFGRGKNKKAPPVNSILAWMQAKPVVLRDARGKFTKSTQEQKKAVAFLIAKSIGIKGIPARNSFNEAVSLVIDEFTDKLSEAYGKDFTISLEKRFRTDDNDNNN